jgi:hypothetical protein
MGMRDIGGRIVGRDSEEGVRMKEGGVVWFVDGRVRSKRI